MLTIYNCVVPIRNDVLTEFVNGPQERRIEKKKQHNIRVGPFIEKCTLFSVMNPAENGKAAGK